MRLPEKRHDLPEPKNWYRLVGPGAIMVATSLGSGEIYFWPNLSVSVGAWILLVGVAALWMQYVMNTEISRWLQNPKMGFSCVSTCGLIPDQGWLH